MNYTCKDCCNPCWERSREYPCTSFKLGKLSAAEARRIRLGKGNDSETKTGEADKEGN